MSVKAAGREKVFQLQAKPYLASMKEKPFLSLGEAIEAFLAKHGLKDEALIQQVIMDWSTLMGKPIAQQTEKIWFKDGVLYIKMGSPVWKNELQMARQKIKDMVNRHTKPNLVVDVKIL